MSYIPHTPQDIAAMLATIGVESVEELLAPVPAALRERARIALPPGLSEPEVRAHLTELAGRNWAARALCFLGAGYYPHAAPAVVDQILMRSEFATAYTPYQPEVSQGTLQATFEFQTLVATLLGLEVANASLYDGASAVAEAVLMARRLLPGRGQVWVSRALHPHYRQVIATYLRPLAGVETSEIGLAEDGSTDLESLRRKLDERSLAMVLGYPNALGVIEDLEAAARLAHQAGALLITATAEALALAMLRSPGAAGVDIAVAEGQSFGLPLSYGGPGVGLFATRERFLRSMPGRVVGETVDERGRRGYVLTLATREQHIRRQRATSNICTNQSLCAIAVAVYLSLLGRHGLKEIARANYASAHDLAARLAAAGARRRFSGPFFNEFAVEAPAACARWEALAEEGLLAGWPLGRWYPELEGSLLVCATEIHGPAARSRLAGVLAAS